MKEHYEQIGNLVAEGKSSKEISDRLNIPVGTINNIRCSILTYYKCHNAVQLAHKFLAAGKIKNIYDNKN